MMNGKARWMMNGRVQPGSGHERVEQGHGEWQMHCEKGEVPKDQGWDEL